MLEQGEKESVCERGKTVNVLKQVPQESENRVGQSIFGAECSGDCLRTGYNG